MTPEKLFALTLWLAREVARLHAANAALQAVVEELRILDPRLSVVNAAQIQVDAWQQFYEHLEDFDPEIAALLDTRSARARDVDADPADES
jgi:hypothetical protein